MLGVVDGGDGAERGKEGGDGRVGALGRDPVHEEAATLELVVGAGGHGRRDEAGNLHQPAEFSFFFLKNKGDHSGEDSPGSSPVILDYSHNVSSHFFSIEVNLLFFTI